MNSELSIFDDAPESFSKEEAIVALAAAGFSVFPVNGKTPLISSWEKTPIGKYGVKEISGRGYGIVIPKGFVIIDVDLRNFEHGDDPHRRLISVVGRLDTFIVRTGGGGLHIYLRIPADMAVVSKLSDYKGIDFKHHVGFVVGPGSIHPVTGRPYEIESGDPSHIADAPQALLDLLKRTETSFSSIGVVDGWKDEEDNQLVYISYLKSAPLAVAGSGGDNTTFAVACRAHDLGLSPKVALELLQKNWNPRCEPPWDESDLAARVFNAYKYAKGAAGNMHPTAVFSSVATPRSQDILTQEGSPLLTGEISPSFASDDSIALTFTHEHGEDWRYVAPWDAWLHWNKSCWIKEQTLAVFDLARASCRTVASRCPKEKATKVSSAGTVAATVRLARADRRHAATVDQWDTNLWLLNTPKAVINLKTGLCQAHDREAYMTKITGASLGGDCPRWLSFLRDVTDGDVEFERYLARVVGYALTGSTCEHSIFFFYGTGANGKSVFLNTIAAVLGDYATTAAIDTFLESHSERHPTDLAGLRGARLVSSIEMTQGKRWAESKIKSLTGGDKVSARFMRQDFFEFVPEFKLMVAGNHKPALRGVDEAMRRRLHLIPFTKTIPAERRDINLATRLLEERDGILRWAVEGCLEWQRDGLKQPKCVLDATEDYFQAEDSLGRWIAEECHTDPLATTLTAALYLSYKTWAEAAREFVGSEKRFSQELADRKFIKWRQPGTGLRGFQGVSLKDKASPSNEDTATADLLGL